MVCAVLLDYVKVSGAAGCDDVETMHLGELDRECADSCCFSMSAIALDSDTFGDQGDSQLPPQTSTESLELDSRGMRKQSLENNASHAVFAASGTVEADA